MKKLLVVLLVMVGLGVKGQNPLVKIWDKRFGGMGDDRLRCFLRTVDGGYMLGGSSLSGIGGDKTQANVDTTFGSFDFWIVKTDSAGTKQWDKTFGGTSDDFLYSISNTSDKGYILGGYSRSGISGDRTEANWDTTGYTGDYWIVKIDSIGTKQWDKRFGGTDRDELHALHQTSDGGYILGGGRGQDLMVINLNRHGEEKIFGS